MIIQKKAVIVGVGRIPNLKLFSSETLSLSDPVPDAYVVKQFQIRMGFRRRRKKKKWAMLMGNETDCWGRGFREEQSE